MPNRPTIVFAMRYPSSIGFVHNNIARTYERVAELLQEETRCVIAYPELSATPAFTPRFMEAIESDFYSSSARHQPALRSLIVARDVRAIVYMGCMPSEIDFRFFRRLGVTTINCEHESYPPDASQPAWKRALKHLLRQRLHWNIHDLYVANAHHQRAFLLNFTGLPPERVVTVVNGVDTTYFCPGPAPDPLDLGVPPTEFYAVTICQARPEKRVDLLIDVAAEVFRRIPKLSLTFVHVGSGECLDAWQAKAAALGLSQRFRFVGFQNDVLPFHRLASVLVHAADRESFGFVLAEAMATGKPVISIDAPGPAEIIQQGTTGFVARRGDVATFAEHVIRLISTPSDLHTMGARARADAVARFDLNRQASELANTVKRSLVQSTTRRCFPGSSR